MSAHRKIMLSMTVFVIAVLLWIVIDLAVRTQTEFALNVAVKAGLWLVFTALELKCNFYMNNYVRAVAILATISDSFFGYYYGLYVTSDSFDKIQHVIGGYAFSLFAYSLVAALMPSNVRPLFKFILVIFLGAGLGAFYEIVEFIGDVLTASAVPSQRSLLDINLDLIADVFGAAIAAIHVVFSTKTLINPNDKLG